MDNARFNKLCVELEQLCDETFGDRRAAYSEVTDRLSNFKEISELTGLPPERVCAVLMGKHITALNKALREGYLHVPKLLSYIIDIINYHKLLWGLLNEQADVGSILPEFGECDCNEQPMPEQANRCPTGETAPGTYHGIQRARKRTPSLF